MRRSPFDFLTRLPLLVLGILALFLQMPLDSWGDHPRPFSVTAEKGDDHPGLRLDFDLRPGNLTELQQELKEHSSQKEGSIVHQLSQLSGLPLIQTPGRPQLPFATFFLQGRPEDFTIEVHLGEGLQLKGVTAPPAPWKPCRCLHHSGNHPAEGESAEGMTAGQEPLPLYRQEYLGDFRGLPLTRIVVHPHSYSSQEQVLTWYPRMQVRIRRKSPRGDALSNLSAQIPAGDFEVGSFILRQLQREAPPRRMLVAAPSRLRDSLATLVAWKRKAGLQVDLLDMEELGSTAAEIKKSLQARYQNSATTFTYALLVGHEENFPTHYVRTGNHPETPTDLLYFLMGGKGDKIPDVFYGRLVADQESEVALQVQKLIQYERGESFAHPGWQRGIGLASNEGQNPSDVEYLRLIEAPLTASQGVRFHEFLQDHAESRADNVNASLSQGAAWLTYLGHGSGHSWESLHHSNYSSQDVPLIRPTPVRPIIIDVSCQNGRFLYDGHLGERFMNESMEGLPLGATAYYGGSVDISWDPPALMAQGITQIYSQGGPEVAFLGETLLAGQMSLYQRYADAQAIYDNFVWYHLLGDPSLLIRLGSLQALQVTLQDQRLLLADESGHPIAGQPVVLWRENGPHQTVVTDQEGKIQVHPETFTNYSILRRGYIYKEGTLSR